ncbi:sterol desaturase family protein [Paenalcaligenes niemegkensis]|uniref:sterol desaturase family protein n=1 Tax=Paenalcaligenes niemegkensis TaxID=2895469 RepID=UPI001EE965E9|nr:sterol desaturase family protein [Paenalcaligenes niemegkensis]MCQ9618189.1 sterol desaturase family protein [Paenalcaligenes niemegkensis]
MAMEIRPMSERQRKFRENYKANISPAYNGLIHVIVMYAVGIATLTYCFMQLNNVGWEWLIAIPVFIAGNLVEWFMHSKVMHRRIDVFGLRQIYERHTREHHQYFTDNEYTIDTSKEFRIVFFPWRVLVTLGAVGAPLGYLTSLLINANAGYIVFMVMVGHYVIYETFHYCCHVPENWFVRNIPFINTIRRHHTAHHNQGIMMRYNMNLTFPISDWLMGTSDLKRGFFGHLFNGYSEEHIKPELKPIIARFRNDDSRVTLDGPLLSPEEQKTVNG